MSDSSNNETPKSLRESLGLPHLFRTLGLAVNRACLAAAFVGLCATLFYGGCVLDPVSRIFGAATVAPDAISRFMTASQADAAYEEPPGELGVFEAFRRHERRAMLGLIASSVATPAPETTDFRFVRPARLRPLHGIASMAYGVWWLVRCHFVYFVFLALGLLLIWSLCGGAVCRIAAVQFARDERISFARAFAYARENLIQGFFLAPCVPLAFMAFFAVLMILYGVIFRIAFVGDLLGGLAFFVMIILGFGIALLAVGSAAGASLFWPAVAIDRSDWADAFQRGLYYPLARPWKALFYAFVTITFAAFCWFFVRLFTYMVLFITHGVVEFGTSPFGLWNRGTEEVPISKLALLWPMSGPEAMYAWPDWSQLSWYECVSGAVIGCYVLTVIGLMWSFLASFYFSGSTIVYFLLRRDVDGTDVEDLRNDEPEPAQGSGTWLPGPSSETSRSPD